MNVSSRLVYVKFEANIYPDESEYYLVLQITGCSLSTWDATDFFLLTGVAAVGLCLASISVCLCLTGSHYELPFLCSHLSYSTNEDKGFFCIFKSAIMRNFCSHVISVECHETVYHLYLLRF